jgi:hypothetical protein
MYTLRQHRSGKQAIASQTFMHLQIGNRNGRTVNAG